MSFNPQVLGEDAQYRLLVEQVSDYGIFLLDAQGRVATWNEGARRLKGYAAPEIVGRHFSAFYTPEDVASGKPDGELRRALDQGRVEDEGWRVRQDGSRFWANVVITRLQGPDGGLLGFAKVTRDISERRHLEAELRAANAALLEQNRKVEQVSRFKSEFLAHMSHELRTPLNSIIGFSEIIQDGRVGPINEKQKEFLGDVLGGARQLLGLINEVLDLAKVESGTLQLRVSSLDLCGLMRSAAALQGPEAGRRRVRLTVECAPGLDGAHGDADRLQQVLHNFLSNAVKFSPAEGEVVLRSRDLGERYRLEVQDQGGGIAPGDQARLFIDFVQLQAGQAHPQGSGLGLAWCRKLVELHGGTVGVTSQAGQGSLFYAELPKQIVPPL